MIDENCFLCDSLSKKVRATEIATSSPRRIEDNFETGCFSSMNSWLPGRSMQAPAPQGPGFSLHEPSVNAKALVGSLSSIVDSIIFRLSSSCKVVLFFDEPRLFQ